MVDPNPSVDGGGAAYLRDRGVVVDIMDGPEAAAARELVTDFTARMRAPTFDEESVTGAQRAALRRLAGRKKAEKTLQELQLSDRVTKSRLKLDDGAGGHDNDLDDATAEEPLVLDPAWLAQGDSMLRAHELILLRLSVDKKSTAKAVGQVVAEQLGAHVAQVVGHTALLYRPSDPPQISLD